MASYLERILDVTRDRLAGDIRRRPFSEVDRSARDAPDPRDFTAAIRAPGMSLIAEFKRRSPSKGPIRNDLDPAGVAQAYESGGARAMSVLTEPNFFDGSMTDLQDAKAASGLPVLRKDFTISTYQVAEARAGGADAVLLIVAALPDRRLFAELLAAAHDYGLAALVEVHEHSELDAALEAGPKLIGVNQRNLSTFEVDVKLALRMRPDIPADIGMVAESGIGSRAEIEDLEEAGVDAVLVGETLMRSPDLAAAARSLLGTG